MENVSGAFWLRSSLGTAERLWERWAPHCKHCLRADSITAVKKHTEEPWQNTPHYSVQNIGVTYDVLE